MAAPVRVEASAEKLAMLARLREQKAALDAAKMATIDAFGALAYEPNCRPRTAARKRIAAELGLHDWRDPMVADTGQLPPLCGKCPQEQFHAATEFDVLYGGAAGGGKSMALVAEGIKWCVRYPGLRVLLVRRSYDELEESILPALRKLSYAAALGGRYNSVKHLLSFPNKSYMTLRYLETIEDASRRQGGSVQLLLIDEYGLLAPGVADFLRYERLRSDGTIPVVGIRATSNPGGASHGEAKARYIEPTDHGRKTYKTEHGHTVRFISAKATDNAHLDPGYFRLLDAIPDPNRRAAMRDGDWDTFAGAIFPELSQERHVVEPMGMPLSWQKVNGIDWGFTKAWATLWLAQDEDGRVWVYRELYATQVGEKDQAERILAAEEPGEYVAARFADDAMWAVRGDAKPIAEVYAENGVWLTPAGKGPGSRVQGWQRIHSYLDEMPACPHHRAKGWETCPRIHFFSTCRNLYNELKNLPYATSGNTEDADPKASDHAADALRYALLNIGGGAEWFTTEPPAATGLPGAPKPLAPLGPWAVREDKTAVVRRRDPDAPVQGAVQLSPFA